jgi:hypothetical protein
VSCPHVSHLYKTGKQIALYKNEEVTGEWKNCVMKRFIICEEKGEAVGEMKREYRILFGRPEGRRPLGRS